MGDGSRLQGSPDAARRATSMSGRPVRPRPCSHDRRLHRPRGGAVATLLAALRARAAERSARGALDAERRARVADAAAAAGLREQMEAPTATGSAISSARRGRRSSC